MSELGRKEANARPAYVRPPKPDFTLDAQHPDVVEFRNILKEPLPTEEVKFLDPTFGGLYRIFRLLKNEQKLQNAMNADFEKRIAALEAEKE